jgi:large subunit ribosomal protein L13
MNKEFPTLVVDASNAQLGRLASFTAKQSLLGKKVIVVNASNALVSGERRMVISEYKEFRQRGGDSLKGPNFPKHSDKLLKRTIRGMLRFRHGRGKDAFKRVLVYDNVPKEYENSKMVKFDKKEMLAKSIKLSELSGEL